MISHKEFFDQAITHLEKIAPGTSVVIVSSDGLALHSNVKDEDAEAQLGSFASVFLDHGKRIFSVPASTSSDGVREDIQTTVTVGAKRVFVLTQLLADAFLVVLGEDKTKTNEFVKKSLEESDRLKSMISKKEIYF
jgi:predicted regulator of Ras-like GTPase activity (Roadblock/LC7/MglB family)